MELLLYKFVPSSSGKFSQIISWMPSFCFFGSIFLGTLIIVYYTSWISPLTLPFFFSPFPFVSLKFLLKSSFSFFLPMLLLGSTTLFSSIPNSQISVHTVPE